MLTSYYWSASVTDSRFDRRRFLLCSLGAALPFSLYSWSASAQTAARSTFAPLTRRPGAKPRNILFVLTDDHRYDAMGFLSKRGYPHTPALDRLARDGVHFKNAFVTTALCSPSRASILTGLYAHQASGGRQQSLRSDRSLIFFPQYLQQAGYADRVHRQVAHGRNATEASDAAAVGSITG